MKNRLPFKMLMLLALMLPPLLLKAQQEVKNKFFFGGGLGIVVGDYFDINIQPMVGYRLTPALVAGVLGKYEYIDMRNVSNPYKVNIYGGGVFLRYDISSLFFKNPTAYNFFTHTEYQFLHNRASFSRLSTAGEKLTSIWNENRWYVGGGFAYGRIYTSILFDMVSLFNEKNSKTPVLNVGFIF